MKSKIVIISLVVIAALVIVAAPSAAAATGVAGGAAQEVEVPTLTEVIALIASGVVVGPAISFMFEKFAIFQKLTPGARWWIVFVASVGLPVAAQALIQYVPAETWASLQPYWKALALGFAGWVTGQVAHAKLNSARARSL